MGPLRTEVYSGTFNGPFMNKDIYNLIIHIDIITILKDKNCYITHLLKKNIYIVNSVLGHAAICMLAILCNIKCLYNC